MRPTVAVPLITGAVTEVMAGTVMVSGTSIAVPVCGTATVSIRVPAGVAVGMVTATDARPVSSPRSTIAGSMADWPSTAPPTLTVAVPLFGSPFENRSEDSPRVTTSPGFASAEDRVTPTARCA